MDGSNLPFTHSEKKPKHRPVEQGRTPYDGLRPWSAITHGIGTVLAAVGSILLLARTVAVGAGIWHLVSFTIYGLSMIGLYTASTLYHCLNTGIPGRIALRKYDHTSIYFLIAGSYTPICLVALRGMGPWGWALFSIIWALALGGLALTLLWVNAPRWMTSGIYLFMGWMALVALYPLYLAVGWRGLFWLLVGGVLYSVGGIIYALKWPGRNNYRFGFHEIFHVFIVLGSTCHFFLMYRVILFL